MATGATGQLGLALPVQGELSGTWGDTVNNGITQYTNLAIAATLTLTDDGAVTLANTTGDAAASNITSTLTGAGTVTAQHAVVRVTGTLTTTKVITAPSYSKTYVVVNAATGGTVTFKASGQTGVSIAVAESAIVYYNGTDYVKIAGTTSGAAAGSTTQVQYNNAGALAGSANLTFDGTTLTATGNAIVSDNSSNAALRITQVGAGNALLVEDSSNPDASPFVVDATGAVVVGATTSSALSINGTPQLSQGGASASASRNAFSRWDASSTGFAMQFGKSRGGAVGTFGAVSSGDNAGQLQFYGDDGTAFVQLATITAVVDGTPGTNDMPGRLQFNTTADGAAAVTERLRITSTGAFGLSGANYGTAGQVLTSQGSGAAPTWAAGGGGGGSSTGANLYLAVNFGGF